ncbi:MAG: hypothetical protein M0R46_13205 [Candidatus Muirbacterium halophilum]|nr:hypothetical protein [Candidatus Muirbacterium halophilum]
MSKQEIKIEFSNDDMLRTLIEKTYFENDQRGKINGKTNFITLDETMEEYEILSGLDKNTIKICNINNIEGSLRVMLEDNNGELRLYPISTYCIKDANKYIFY